MDNQISNTNAENKKINTAITLLEAFTKKVVESDENYIIFLPKFKINDTQNEVEFPVFNKNDGQLIGWLIYDFNTYVIEYDENETLFQIDMKDYAELDYIDEKYQQNLELLVDILAYTKKLLKLEKDSEEFQKIIYGIQEKIQQYDEILANTVIEELYNIYFVSEDDNLEEISEEDNQEYEELEEQNEIEFEEIEQVDLEEKDETELEEVEDVTVEEIESEVTEQDISEKLIEFSKNELNKENIDFDWEQKDGLRYVSDESLELAYKLLKKLEISLELKNEKVILHNNMIKLCDYKYSSSELLEKIKNNEEVITKSNDFSVKQNLTINRICYGCKFQKCPKHLVAYLYYLMNKDLLVEKLEDREKFREENEVNNQYAFDWKYGDILRLIPDDIYDFAFELTRRNLIYVEKYLKKDKIDIKTPFTCTEIKLMGGQIKKITETNKDYDDWTCITRNPNNKIRLCDTYSCGIHGCPTAIAGIIQYLINCEKIDVLIKERDYYHEHKEEMDAELEKVINEKFEKIEKNKEKIAENFEEYKEKIENFDDLIFALTNKNQNNLHCTIEGEDVIGKNEIIKNVVDLLYQTEKIREKNYRKISLQNLAASNAYFSGKFAPNYKPEEETDLNGVLYAVDSASKYTMLEERKIYIINKIGEFIKDFRIYDKHYSNTYLESRNKQFQHALKLLTEISYKNYIILDGTTEEIDELLELEPKLKFIYKNYRFKFPDISLDEVFELYKKELKNNVIAKLLKDEPQYKEKFLEYVGLNKNFMPFTTREIASFLAMHSNSKDDIVFPENIYKKETVDEALNNIIGLEAVKKKVKEFEKYVMFKVKAETLGMQLANSNMHMIFTGNPGVGKTTIARIMAKMLFDLGVIKENKLVEVERKDLVGSYIGHTAPKTAEVIESAMGGVLFIDEAYSLAPKLGNDFGREAIATLIKAMEDHKGEFVVIFAGYKDEMKGFIDSNPGIASRIGYTFDFPDYSVAELVEIYHKKISNMGFECSKETEIELKKICEYFSKRKAFGNGRFVDKLIQEVIMKHALNDYKDIKKISKEDMPTIKELNNTTEIEESTEDLLENIIGLEPVKKKVREFEKYVQFELKADKLGLKVGKTNMHMIFTGNPGVGKTTIARIMAKMLFDLGVIKENKLVEVERKDLVGSHIGQTAPKTSEVIEKAMGGVLFIDEAYSLAPNIGNDFGAEAIATLIKAMEDHKGEFVVIFAGYKDEMKVFIDSNPGIASRIGYTFDFPDYTVTELLEMFKKRVSNMGFKCSKECDIELKRIFDYFSTRKSFGNGRFVDKLIQEVMIKHAMNDSENTEVLDAIDIPTIKEFNNATEPEESTEELLANVIGLENLKQKIEEFEQYVKFLKEAEKNNIKIPNQNMHMIFTGNPGTGKTTIARIMAKILYNAGILQENKLVEVERKDLIAGYVGQTAPKTTEVIEKAMGGVLFIDEAYSLTFGNNAQYDFGGEAIATLIKAMEDHKGEFVVIFAGYQKEMADFINANSGIASRIGYTFNFEDYTREELAEILYKKIEKSNLQIEEKAKDKVCVIMNYFCNVENIGNGRFVDRVFQEILLKHSKNKKADINKIQESDIPTIEEMTNCLFDGQYMIKPDQITDEALKETAIHEIGHAFMRYKLFDNPGIMKITINPEGNGRLGYVQYKIIKESYVQKKSTLLNRIKVSLAGMIAEEVFTGEFANGNTSDLEKATRIATNMITRYGMSSLGFGQIDKTNEAMGEKIQEEVNKILNECYEETTEIIKNNKDLMQKVVDYLLEHKEIDEEQFLKVLKTKI